MTLSELRAKAEAATAGEWFTESDGIYNATRLYLITPTGDSDQDRTDADYIAAANPATILALLDRLEAAEVVCEAAQRTAESGGEDLGDCPYFARYEALPDHDPEAVCGYGCRDEPSCVTDMPREGWPRFALADALCQWEENR